jgi:hypothetical protein
MRDFASIKAVQFIVCSVQLNAVHGAVTLLWRTGPAYRWACSMSHVLGAAVRLIQDASVAAYLSPWVM